jgi:ABC-type transport system substrate-binding protein
VSDFFEYFDMVDKGTVEGPNAKTTTVGTGRFRLSSGSPAITCRSPGTRITGRLAARMWTDAAKANAYSFNLEKARAMLQEAGVTNLETDCLLTTSTEWNIACQIYQADLSKLGIKLNIKVLETAAWLDQVNNRKYVGGYWSPAAYGQLAPGTTFGGTKAWDPFNNNEGFKRVMPMPNSSRPRVQEPMRPGRSRSMRS